MNKSIWPENQPTTELLAEARQGDSAAIDQLLERHRESLRRLVGMRIDQKLLQRIDVSDVVQDVLIEANRRLATYLENPVMAFHLWIRQIAKDRMIDAHRRHRVSAKRSIDREQNVATNYATNQSTLDLVAELSDRELTPAAAATHQELAEQLQNAIGQLDPRDQEIVMMRHFEQLTNQEIAQALGLSEPAASMRYLRAVKRLRSLLGERPSQD